MRSSPQNHHCKSEELKDLEQPPPKKPTKTQNTKKKKASLKNPKLARGEGYVIAIPSAAC